MPGEMSPSMNSVEASKLKENHQYEPQVRLSRSPHPYHRRPLRRETIDCGPLLGPPNAKEQAQGKQSPGVWTNNRHSVYRSDSSKFLYGRQRTTSSSPSESGTEADDEGGGLLKGLPAPPLKPHKGLKEHVGDRAFSTSSPLLTPSHDENDRYVLQSELLESQDRKGRNSAKEDELRSIRKRLAQKKRGELRRRVVEVVLMLTVGSISYSSMQLHTIMGGDRLEAGDHLGDRTLQMKIPFEQLQIYGLILGTIYGSHLLRLSWGYFGRSASLDFLDTIHKAASLDPAPFLYPIMIPTSVAFSMFSMRSRFLLPNLVLGICSIPPSMVLFSSYSPTLLQPFLSLLPFLLADRPYAHRAGDQRFFSSSFSSIRTEKEAFTLLPFIHQSLVPSIHFLTTTSLLPAELQLLATSLINLLILSESPQATILKALLWIGGVSLYVTCRHVVRWTVAISRIPSWRFRQSYHPSLKRATLLTAIDDCFGGHLGRWSRFPQDESSDEEDKMNALSGRRRKHLPAISVSTFLKSNESALGLRKVLTNATVDPERPNAAQLNGGVGPPGWQQPRQRRHTLPTSLQGPSDHRELVTNNSSSQHRAKSSKNTRPTLFLSLSRAQADVLRWIYASYVYIVVLVVIALPVHWYIQIRAVSGHEPVGWALGYLFGDLPAFRLQTVMWNLESWVCLPPRKGPTSSRALAERIFVDYLGAANTRLLISAYCVMVITLGLIAVFSLSPVAEVDTRRKVFHGMMVAMFLPAIFVDPTFAALALELILAIFLLLDLFRSSQLPPVSKPLTHFLAPYVDGRDHRGPVIVSHIFLLIGCSIPLWLSLVTTERTGSGAFQGWDVATRDLSMIAGVVCVGMGDAAASLFGRRYGRHRWPWSGGKSIEGSAAFALAVILGLVMARLWLLVGGWKGDSGDSWLLTLGKALIAASGASLTEAVLTGGNDNVIVPVILWLLVRGLAM